MTIWSKFKTCNRGINIEHKQIPKYILTDDENYQGTPYVTRHAKRYELGGRRHFEKIRLKVNVASRKNSTPKRVSKRSLTYYKTGSKAFFNVEVFCHQTVKYFVRY